MVKKCQEVTVGPWVFSHFQIWPSLKKVWAPLMNLMTSQDCNPDDITEISSGLFPQTTENIIHIFSQDDNYSSWRTNGSKCVKWAECFLLNPSHLFLMCYLIQLLPLVFYEKLYTQCDESMGCSLPNTVSWTRRGQEVFTTVSAATHHRQLRVWRLMRRLITGHVEEGF